MKFNQWRNTVVLGVLSLTTSGAAAANKPQNTLPKLVEPTIREPSKVDARADAVLRNMSDFMAAQVEFSFISKADEVTSTVDVKRPNMLRSAGHDVVLYYDGETVTISKQSLAQYS